MVTKKLSFSLTICGCRITDDDFDTLFPYWAYKYASDFL